MSPRAPAEQGQSTHHGFNELVTEAESAERRPTGRVDHPPAPGWATSRRGAGVVKPSGPLLMDGLSFTLPPWHHRRHRTDGAGKTTLSG